MKYILSFFCFLPFVAFAQDKVGIGTTTPGSKLDIAATGDGTEILRFSTERPWVFKQRLTGSNTRLTLQPTLNDHWFDILSSNGLVRVAEFFSSNAASKVILVPEGGTVGIGQDNPLGKLHIRYNSTTVNPDIRITETTFNFARIKMENVARPNTFWDIAGLADTVTSNAKLNFYFSSPGSTGDRMTITGAGNVGIGTTVPGNRLRVNGDPASTLNVLSAAVNYIGNANIRAVEGIATPAAGFGLGGHMTGGSVGVQGVGSGGNYAGITYGVLGSASGTTGTRIGVYGTATGGTLNWAGYFSGGHVYVTNELRIGTDAAGGVPGYRVAVDGKIIAEEVRVQLSGAWPDYVFEETYPLTSIDNLSHFIRTHKHLPGVPSAPEVEDQGIAVGEMQKILLEKIEELTLHIIQLNERMKELEKK